MFKCVWGVPRVPRVVDLASWRGDEGDGECSSVEVCVCVCGGLESPMRCGSGLRGRRGMFKCVWGGDTHSHAHNAAVDKKCKTLCQNKRSMGMFPEAYLDRLRGGGELLSRKYRPSLYVEVTHTGTMTQSG